MAPIARISRIRPFWFVWSALVLALLALPAAAQTTVRVGVLGAFRDAGFFIADKKGLFCRAGHRRRFRAVQGIDGNDRPLGGRQLDVGAGAPTAGFDNGLARGMDIRIVADKGSMPPLYGYVPLIVRKDLIDSGRFIGLKDLKGLRVGSLSPGGFAIATLERALAMSGRTIDDRGTGLSRPSAAGARHHQPCHRCRLHHRAQRH